MISSHKMPLLCFKFWQFAFSGISQAHPLRDVAAVHVHAAGHGVKHLAQNFSQILELVGRFVCVFALQPHLVSHKHHHRHLYRCSTVWAPLLWLQQTAGVAQCFSHQLSVHATHVDRVHGGWETAGTASGLGVSSRAGEPSVVRGLLAIIMRNMLLQFGGQKQSVSQVSYAVAGDTMHPLTGSSLSQQPAPGCEY